MALKEAEIVIFVVDASTGISNDDLEIMQQIESKRKLVVINKEDIENRVLDKMKWRPCFEVPVVEISALEKPVSLIWRMH